MDSAGGGAPWRGSRGQANSMGSAGGSGGPGNQMGPPSAIQGAMMKDKKPFTYTPGGINLSEIKSPRMAKRIQMNAAAEGVSSVPQQSNNSSPGGGYHLPPASIAAMQPQLPVAVFPQGGLNPANLHKTSKPNDYCQPSSENSNSHAPHVQSIPPPPPPPPPSQFQNIPPPPPERFSVPSPNSEARARNFKETHQEAAISPRPSNAPPLSLASFMKQTIKATPDYDDDRSTDMPSPVSPQNFAQRPVQNVNSQPQAEQKSPQIQPQRPMQYVNSNQQQADQTSPQFRTQSPMQNQSQVQSESRSPQLYSQRPMQGLSSPQAEQNNHIHDERHEGQSSAKLYQFDQQRIEPKGPPPPTRQAVRSPPVQTQTSEPVVEQKIPMSIFQSENGEQSPLVFQQITSPNGTQIYQHRPGKQVQPQPSMPVNTKVINLGTLYIPPIEKRSTINDREEKSTPEIQRNSSIESDSDKERSAPQTPVLNKAPTPWMNSRNRIQQGSPSFASAGNTPWGKAKVIPINLVDNRSDAQGDANVEQIQVQPPKSVPVTPQVAKSNQAGAMSNGGRIIAIQIEGASKPNVAPSVRTPATPTTNSRSNPYFMQNQKPTGEPLSNDRLTENDGQWADPTQSKSFRVLQRITDDGDATPPTQSGSGKGHTIQIRVEPQAKPVVASSQQQYQFPVEYIASAENPKVHPSQQKISEPKLYMGKNIPSYSFKMLQKLTGEDGPSNSGHTSDM